MQSYDNFYLTTYITGNLSNSFEDRPEFELHSIAETQPLWNSLCEIITNSISTEDDVIVFCLGKHQFTGEYDNKSFITDIINSASLGSQLLIGGCASFGNAVPITKRLYWVDGVEGLYFFVVFRSAYEYILKAVPKEDEDVGCVLSRTLSNKILIVPQILAMGVECKTNQKLTTYQRIIDKYNIF